MTEKRYYVIHDNTDGIDKVRDRHTHSYMSADNICYKLNEIQELEKEAEIYNEDAMSYQTLYEQQVEKNKKLNQLIIKIEDNLNRYKVINCLEYENWKKEIWRNK